MAQPQERFTNKLEVSDDEGPEIAPVAKPTLVKAEAVAPQKKPAPVQDEGIDGSDYVEFTDPKVKARFSRVYRHAKEANERAERTENQMALLAQQNKELQKALEKIAGGIKDRETRAEIGTLRQEAQDALATGDTKAFAEVNERLVEIKVDAKKAAEEKPEVKEDPEITDTELKIMGQWQHEKDEDGDFIRPWANPKHKEFPATMEMLRKISASPAMEGATVRELLAAVDKRMKRMLSDDDEEPAPKRRRASSDDDDEEEDGNLVRRAFSAPRSEGRRAPRDEQTTLSPQEKAIAESMFLGGRGSVAKTAKEAHETYLKQKRTLSRVVAVED